MTPDEKPLDDQWNENYVLVHRWACKRCGELVCTRWKHDAWHKGSDQ